MYTKQKSTEFDAQERRKQGGLYLRKLREKRGLSQRELAKLVDVQYYTFISQLETGRGRIPPDSYQLWARALRVNCRSFVRGLLSFYDPITHQILFGESKLDDLSPRAADEVRISQ
jgi:transcriptional regulator with XRE-family HTH domain